MKEIVLVVTLLFLVAPLGSFAGQAQVKGTLKINGKSARMSAGIAHLHDNAEGILDTTKELRILLADRNVDDAELRGLVFLGVDEMAKQGTLQGILVKLDPDDPGKVLVTLLWQPPDPHTLLVNQTLTSSSKDIIKNFSIDNGMVSGEISYRDSGEHEFESTPTVNYSIKFRVPLFSEPAITEDLRGKNAKKSPLAALYARIADATAKGDVKAVAQYSSASSRKELDLLLSQPSPEVLKMMKESGREMKKNVRKIARIVVRGDRAVILFEGNKEWQNFLKEDGEWKTN